MFDTGQRSSLIFCQDSWLCHFLADGMHAGRGGRGEGRRNWVNHACACIRSVFIANKHAKCRRPHPYAHDMPTKTYTHMNLYKHTKRWEVQALNLNSSFTRSEIRDVLADSDSVSMISLWRVQAQQKVPLCVSCVVSAMPFGEEWFTTHLLAVFHLPDNHSVWILHL